jgi:hypothetical protein
MKTFLYNHRGDRDFKQLGDGCTVLHRRGVSTGPACEPEDPRLGREDHHEERTRERAPLDWAMSTGNQGVALMLLAEREFRALPNDR